jgi:Arc/MetJ-type ribon-helix-helix transcriptional regulator
MTKKYVTVSLDFSEEAYKRLKEMVEEIDDAPNAGDVVRRGLRLLDLWEEELRNGNKFCLLYPDGNTQQIDVGF